MGGGGGGEASSVVPHGNHATLTLHIQPLGGLHNPMMEEESMEPRHNFSDAAFLCPPSPTRAINKTADGIDSDCWYSLSSRCLLPTAHQFHSTLPPPSLLSFSLSRPLSYRAERNAEHSRKRDSAICSVRQCRPCNGRYKRAGKGRSENEVARSADCR